MLRFPAPQTPPAAARFSAARESCICTRNVRHESRADAHYSCSRPGLVDSPLVQRVRARRVAPGPVATGRGRRLARAIEHSATAGSMVATTFEPSSAASPRKNRLRTPRAHPSRTGREWPVTAGMKRSYRSSCARHRARARVRDGKQGGTAATRHTPATSSLLDDLTRKGCHHDLPQGRPHARARGSDPR